MKNKKKLIVQTPFHVYRVSCFIRHTVETQMFEDVVMTHMGWNVDLISSSHTNVLKQTDVGGKIYTIIYSLVNLD